jgi:Domain of unknown function (DUF4157)
MAQRSKMRRALRRTTPRVRRAAGVTAATRGPARREQTPAGGLTIGGAHDPAEKAADRAAERVMRMPAAPRFVQRECAECADEKEAKRQPAGEEEEQVRKKAAGGAAPVAPGASSAPASAGQARAIGSLGAGRALASAERAFFEPRFGADLSPVRVHDGAAADRASKAIDARAFSLGHDVAFARGEYVPGTDSGRRLMAHELAHSLEDGPARRSIRRKAPDTAEKDPLCDSYSFWILKVVLRDQLDKLVASGNSEDRLKVIQRLKIFHRCGTGSEIPMIKALLTEKLGAAEADELWKSAGTPFGGYRGVYPGYYSGKKWLAGLGTSEVEPFPSFDYNPRKKGDGSKFHPGGERTASAMAGTVERTDILYFFGHQYAQHSYAGAFANDPETQYIDLRKLQGKGDFSRVKLLISTSCATICADALSWFTRLFPNAVILGYRKKAPKQGEKVRSGFDAAIKSLKKPLLLDQPVDVSAIIDVWKSVVQKQHPNEATRLPGYYKDGKVYYLENGRWKYMLGASEGNKCMINSTQI